MTTLETCQAFGPTYPGCPEILQAEEDRIAAEEAAKNGGDMSGEGDMMMMDMDPAMGQMTYTAVAVMSSAWYILASTRYSDRYDYSAYDGTFSGFNPLTVMS